MSRKDELINKAIKDDPLNFTDAEAWELSSLISLLEIRSMIARVYDMNEEILSELSDASLGSLGKKNKKSTEKRIKEYYKRIRKNNISYKPEGKKILAEGDSWFQFPMIVTDIIDWLNKNPNNAIYSIAYGGDWITNIIYDGDYISELPIHDPDVFLISGGGNDLVGGNRLATMVDTETQTEKRTRQGLEKIDDLSTWEIDRILEAQPFIRPEFYAFLNTLKVMYDKIITGIRKKHDMMIITQGYDYAFPRWAQTSLFKPAEYFENWVVDSGRWLKRPLTIKAIPEEKQRPIIVAMIFEFNEMFKLIAQKHENVYHVDSRGNAPEVGDWIDELHLKSKVFERVANAYQTLIDGKIEDEVKESKVLRVKSFF